MASGPKKVFVDPNEWRASRRFRALTLHNARKLARKNRCKVSIVGKDRASWWLIAEVISYR